MKNCSHIFKDFTLCHRIIKETGQDLIKKILDLIISRLTGIIFCFHQTQTPENPITLFWKSLNLYLTLNLWLTLGLQISISIKNQFLSKIIKLKDPCKKGSPYKIQVIQKLFINTIKKSEQFYFTRFFQENVKDIKNMWERIKKIISSNDSNHTFPSANNEASTNPTPTANVFNSYFAKYAIDVQSSIRFS